MTNVRALEDLQHPDAEALLQSPDPARLAYAGPDGFPRVIPIGFWWTGTDIVVCTAPTAPKVKALAQRPNVASLLRVEGKDKGQPWWWEGVEVIEWRAP